MKTKIFLGCIMAASLITVSCSDLLQENPQGKLTPEGYFSTHMGHRTKRILRIERKRF